MNTFFITMTYLGLFIMIFGLISLFIKEKLYLSETLVAAIFGVIIGPHALKITEIDGYYISHFSRIVICLQVICVGMIVPKNYLMNEKRSLFMLLVPCLIVTYIISSLIIHYVLNLGWRYSFILGACVTPTDPVLSSTVVKGKFANRYVPQHLRNLLIIESGANDGLGFPMLTLPLYFLTSSTKSDAITAWCCRTIIVEVILAMGLGIIIGFISRKLLYYSAERKLIDKESFLAYLIALALFVTGITAYFKLDDILACFVTGIVFAYNRTLINDIKESHLYEVIDLLCNLSFFIFFGASIPFKELSWKYILTGLLLVVFRRAPVIFLFKGLIPQLFNNREAFFAGWFGPIGVGAIFFGYHAQHAIKDCDAIFVAKHQAFYDSLMPVIYSIVMCSIIVHGITAPIIHIHLKRKRSNKNVMEVSESEYTEYEGQNKLESLLLEE